MTPPRPDALRLVTIARDVRLPLPPFGLRTWTPDAGAIAVMLDPSGGDLEDPGAVAAQLPRPDTVPARSLVFVLGVAARSDGLLRRWVSRGSSVPRESRCSALLARGYVEIGARVDETSGADLAWGWSP